jgi:sec-independent protein translocase protein TatA
MLTGVLQPSHLILILIVALLFLGPKRIPQAGRALGQGLKEFKNSIGGVEEDLPLPARTALVQDENPPGDGPSRTALPGSPPDTETRTTDAPALNALPAGRSSP